MPSHSLSASLAALLQTQSPRRVCTQPLETGCRMVQMRHWGKFRATALQCSRDRTAGEIPMSPLKSAALLGLFQPPPKAPFQDVVRNQIFTATFNSFGIRTGLKKASLASLLPQRTCTQADFQGLQEQCCKVWDKLISAASSLWLSC